MVIAFQGWLNSNQRCIIFKETERQRLRQREGEEARDCERETVGMKGWGKKETLKK